MPRKYPEEIINKMEREGEYSEDEDDLDITKVVHRGLKGTDKYIKKVIDLEATDDEDEVDSPRQRKRTRLSSEERLGWSSDEVGEELDPAYQAFRARMSHKRKRGSSTKTAVKARITNGISTSRARGKQPEDRVVGKRAPPKPKKKRRIWQNEATGDDDTDADDRLDDEHLPEYLARRKESFEEAKERLGLAGLKLPPTYDEIYFSDDDRMRELVEKPALPNLEPVRPYEDIEMDHSGGVIPAPLAQRLRDYQVDGVKFLHELFAWQRGGVLGDDMGLGKTIQVISFLTAAFGKTGDERDRKRMRKMRRDRSKPWYPRVLIICPTSVLEQWESELDTWGWWEYCRYHGSSDVKEDAINQARQGRCEIMITAYTTYRLNKGDINTVDWDCVIADECHKIKDRKTETTVAMNEINALCRIGLTGTAIQNNYDELWTLLNWCNPGRFGSLASWKSSISKPLQLGQAHDATSYQLGIARKTAVKLVKNLLPQFFLRRMKTLIAHQLPKKSDRVIFCPLSDKQAVAYENYIDGDLVQAIKTASDMCDCGSGKKNGWCCYKLMEDGSRWQDHVFPCMMTLTKLTNHLALLIPSGRDPKEKQDKDVEHLKAACPDEWMEMFDSRDSIKNYAVPDYCGKWKILQKLLTYWHADPQGHKVLVFSHSVRLLKMLELLFRSTTSYNVSYLDGSMKPEDRWIAVQDFNSDPEQFVFLISTKAGGIGLNITSANKVVIMDPNWNPSYDLQAQDRAYRIGQTRDVEVFRLISKGTIEEIVYARQIYKQQQANIGYTASSERRYFTGVQDNKEKKGEIFGLANIFSYHGEGVVMQGIVNKLNVAESRFGVTTSEDIAMEGASYDDNDPIEDEDEAMKMLGDEITGGDPNVPRPKRTMPGRKDPVQAILANAGVEYTHENSEVIGTSKTEAKLSRQAAENTASAGGGNDKPIFGSNSQTTDAKGIFEIEGFQYRFNPPVDVRRRQFCTMAKVFGFGSATEFALVVEGWTQEQRRNCLERFYRMRREDILKSEGVDITATKDDEEDDDEL